MKQRIFSLLLLLVFLVACTPKDTVVFQDNVTIEYGSSINPIDWVKGGRFDAIDILEIDEKKLGTQTITLQITNGKEKTQQEKVITIVDTKGPMISEIQPFVVGFDEVISISQYYHAKDLRDGDVIIDFTPVNTKKLGTEKVRLWATDKEGNRTLKDVMVNVIDDNPPIIKQIKEIIVFKDREFKIEEFIRIEDEQKDLVTIEVKNEYDLSQLGHYPIIVEASDPSGNVQQFETILTVALSSQDEGDGYTIVEPAKLNDKYTLVNRRYQLPTDYIPENLVYVPEQYRIGNVAATLNTVAAFEEMAKAAAQDGIELKVQFGYISYWEQNILYNQSVSELGFVDANKIIQRPGHSEHQLGVALDLCDTSNKCGEDFNNTPADRWLQSHASEYGFILRYPKNKQEVTLSESMSNHYRFVGKEVAKHYVEVKLSYEEYYQQFSDNLK